MGDGCASVLSCGAIIIGCYFSEASRYAVHAGRAVVQVGSARP